MPPSSSPQEPVSCTIGCIPAAIMFGVAVGLFLATVVQVFRVLT